MILTGPVGRTKYVKVTIIPDYSAITETFSILQEIRTQFDREQITSTFQEPWSFET